RAAAMQGQMNLLEHEARHHFVDGVRGFVNAMKPTYYHCDNFQDNRGTGYSCSDRPTGQSGLVAQLDRILDEADPLGKKALSVTDPACASLRLHDYDYILTLINADRTEYITRYFSKRWVIGASGKLELPAEANDWLLVALQDDPIFLNRLQIDYLG